jgi:hypothetical protein
VDDGMAAHFGQSGSLLHSLDGMRESTEPFYMVEENPCKQKDQFSNVKEHNKRRHSYTIVCH